MWPVKIKYLWKPFSNKTPGRKKGCHVTESRHLALRRYQQVQVDVNLSTCSTTCWVLMHSQVNKSRIFPNTPFFLRFLGVYLELNRIEFRVKNHNLNTSSRVLEKCEVVLTKQAKNYWSSLPQLTITLDIVLFLISSIFVANNYIDSDPLIVLAWYLLYSKCFILHFAEPFIVVF